MQPPVELQVYLLGSARIQQRKTALNIPRLKARALFYRLAVHLEPVARAHLCFLFWPDSPDTLARRNLTLLLSHLRRALPASACLTTGSEQVQLEPARVWSDSADFERLTAGQTSSQHL